MTASTDDAPFPLGSVQAVASRAWELCLREDPVGLVAIPFVISFPVTVFLTSLSELFRNPRDLSAEAGATLPQLPFPPPSRPMSARSTPTSTASTLATHGSFKTRESWTPSAMMRCWKWLPVGQK